MPHAVPVLPPTGPCAAEFSHLLLLAGTGEAQVRVQTSRCPHLGPGLSLTSSQRTCQPPRRAGCADVSTHACGGLERSRWPRGVKPGSEG